MFYNRRVITLLFAKSFYVIWDFVLRKREVRVIFNVRSSKVNIALIALSTKNSLQTYVKTTFQTMLVTSLYIILSVLSVLYSN